MKTTKLSKLVFCVVALCLAAPESDAQQRRRHIRFDMECPPEDGSTVGMVQFIEPREVVDVGTYCRVCPDNRGRMLGIDPRGDLIDIFFNGIGRGGPRTDRPYSLPYSCNGVFSIGNPSNQNRIMISLDAFYRR